jgi:O-antigen ligase
VMTRSRAPWITCLVGLGFVFFFLGGKNRMRLLALAVGAGAVTVLGTYLMLGPVITDLILDGTLQRFSSLSGAAATDISWLHRMGEAQAVIQKGARSPILGWGFGASYDYFDIIFKFTYSGSFVHNGYVALWFKLGIWGFIMMMMLWFGVIIRTIKSLRFNMPTINRAIILSIGGYLIGLTLLTHTSNPFPVRDQLLFLAIALAIAEGLVQRHCAGSGSTSTGVLGGA